MLTMWMEMLRAQVMTPKTWAVARRRRLLVMRRPGVTGGGAGLLLLHLRTPVTVVLRANGCLRTPRPSARFLLPLLAIGWWG